MKLADHLSREQHEKLKRMKQNNKRKKKRKNKPERIDWHDLMGVNRDTYKRGKGGAMRSNKR
jgi:hypothetical protein